MNSNMKGILGSSFYELPPPSFLLILERKLFDELREKISRPHHLFSFFPTTQPNTLQKVFVPIFSQKVSIHPISPSNRHTLRGKRGGGGEGNDLESSFLFWNHNLEPQNLSKSKPKKFSIHFFLKPHFFHPFIPWKKLLI